MIEFDYDALSAVAAVAREGTFEAAAKSLNVTQSAVSQRIKQLEERLGSILIVRGRPCVPTEFGLQLCRHVDHVLLLEHELKRALPSEGVDSDGAPVMLRVVVNSDSLSTWFPEIIRRAEQEINVQFDILADDQEYSTERLKSGEALAALTANNTPLQGFRHLSLGAMEYMAVATPALYEQHFGQSGVTQEALQGASCLLFDRKDTLPHMWLKKAIGESHALSGNLIPSYEGYLACCLNGSGWGMMPTETVRPYLENGRLVELVPNKRTYVSLYWQSSAQGTETFRQLAEIVTQVSAQRLIAEGDIPE